MQMAKDEKSDFDVFYIAGIGCSDSGEGSGYAWLEPKTDTRWKREAYGFSVHASNFSALLSVVCHLPAGTKARVLTDSTILHRYHNGGRDVQDERLLDIAQLTTQMTWEKKLVIQVEKIKRNRNRARKLLL